MVVTAIRNAKSRKMKRTIAKVGANLVAAAAAPDTGALVETNDAPHPLHMLIEKEGIGPRGKTGKITHRLRNGIDFYSCSDLAAKQVDRLIDDLRDVYGKTSTLSLFERGTGNAPYEMVMVVKKNDRTVAEVCLVAGYSEQSYVRRSQKIFNALGSTSRAWAINGLQK